MLPFLLATDIVLEEIVQHFFAFLRDVGIIVYMVIRFEHSPLDKSSWLGHFGVNEHELSLFVPILFENLLLYLQVLLIVGLVRSKITFGVETTRLCVLGLLDSLALFRAQLRTIFFPLLLQHFRIKC